MPKIRRGYEFTDKQEEAIGQLVVDYWGGHIVQTGFDESNVPYMYFQMAPNTPTNGFNISPDGTVTRIGT